MKWIKLIENVNLEFLLKFLKIDLLPIDLSNEKLFCHFDIIFAFGNKHTIEKVVAKREIAHYYKNVFKIV